MARLDGEQISSRNCSHKNSPIAVLTEDYMSVPDEEIGSIESVLTLLGGDVVYAADPYAQLARD